MDGEEGIDVDDDDEAVKKDLRLEDVRPSETTRFMLVADISTGVRPRRDQGSTAAR